MGCAPPSKYERIYTTVEFIYVFPFLTDKTRSVESVSSREISLQLESVKKILESFIGFFVKLILMTRNSSKFLSY
jgi:hypothetical protein